MTTEFKMRMIQNMLDNLQKVNSHYDYEWEINSQLDSCLDGLILLMRYKIGEPAKPKESVQEPKCARNGCDNKAYPKSESSPCWDCKSCCLNPRHWNLCDHHFQEEHGHDEDEDEPVCQSCSATKEFHNDELCDWIDKK